MDCHSAKKKLPLDFELMFLTALDNTEISL